MDAGKVVDAARGQALADEFGMLFFEASAKDNINVEESFVAIARDIKMRLLDKGADAEAMVILAFHVIRTFCPFLWMGLS
jgi:Ras-related protein Rab-8A